MPPQRPHSTACERNREPILAVLRDVLAGRRRVLEIGSGTGQHAVHFAAALPHLVWQCSDRAENLPGIGAWLDHAGLANTPPPLTLDVGQRDWPALRFDALFTANTLHIMAWHEVERLFERLDEVLEPDAPLIVYGPFHDAGVPSSPSNAEFDRWLQAQAPHMGVRDIEAIDALALRGGRHRRATHALPANNRCVIWQRPEAPP